MNVGQMSECPRKMGGWWKEWQKKRKQGSRPNELDPFVATLGRSLSIFGSIYIGGTGRDAASFTRRVVRTLFSWLSAGQL
jgi:hypothetical protein